MDVRGFNLAGGITANAEGSAEPEMKLKDAAKGMVSTLSSAQRLPRR